jgi:hypothetical protein
LLWAGEAKERRHGGTMTPEQCRAACRLQNWSQDDLAKASRVPVEIVAMFEDGELAGMIDCQVAMREALESAWRWLFPTERYGGEGVGSPAR